MPDPLHESELENLDNGDQYCFKPLPIAEETLTCMNFDKGLMGDTVGDNVTFDVLSENKYSLEMNTTCKSDRLRLARGAMGNKFFSAQNKQFLALFPFMGYTAALKTLVPTLYVQIFWLCINYCVRMVDTIMRACKYLFIHS